MGLEPYAITDENNPTSERMTYYDLTLVINCPTKYKKILASTGGKSFALKDVFPTGKMVALIKCAQQIIK